MDYAKLLAECDAGKAIPPLAERVRKLEKQRAAVLDRLKNERENLALAEATLADFKGRAAEQLARGTSAYQEFQGRLRRLKLEAETAREALALLDAETRPAVERELADAREKLSQALAALYIAARPRCQSRMAELLDAVVAEHDAYFFACKQLHRDHGFAFVTPAFDSGIVAEHARVSRCGKRSLTSLMSFVAFTDPPEAKPDVAKEAVQSVQDPEKAPQDALSGAISPAPDTLPCPDADTEKKGSRLPLGATPGPAGVDADAGTLPPDLDAQDCAAVDAEYQADLDADAPPDAGEKNPGIAPDFS